MYVLKRLALRFSRELDAERITDGGYQYPLRGHERLAAFITASISTRLDVHFTPPLRNRRQMYFCEVGVEKPFAPIRRKFPVRSKRFLGKSTNSLLHISCSECERREDPQWAYLILNINNTDVILTNVKYLILNILWWSLRCRAKRWDLRTAALPPLGYSDAPVPPACRETPW